MSSSPYQRITPKDKEEYQSAPEARLWKVVDGGEMDGLVGVFEDFLDELLEPVDGCENAVHIMLFFPVSRQAQEKYELVGVNDFLGGQVAYLRDNNYRLYFEIRADKPTLEEVSNPEDL
jgi:hypothetical protein